MDLSTRYLGFELEHPFMPGASPLDRDLDTVRRLEDVGAPMIVLHSLFEEQVRQSARGRQGVYGPDEYCEHLHRVKETVSVPVVASLNGMTLGGWLDTAQMLQSAGADALELNVYELVMDLDESAERIEKRTLEMVGSVKEEVSLPLAVKLSPYYTAFGHFARCLDAIGADGMVLFNRFYQADIDPEELDVSPILHLSNNSELLLRLRWLALLSGRVDGSLAVTGGVHSALDGLKAILCGANAVQVVSVLLERGPQFLGSLRKGLERWMEEHGYESLSRLCGILNLKSCPDPAAFERANYVHLLESYGSEH